jgi:ectoine hydroxylase-related dioxygenase (phytanoyl-CoA dioxygenase family)
MDRAQPLFALQHKQTPYWHKKTPQNLLCIFPWCHFGADIGACLPKSHIAQGLVKTFEPRFTPRWNSFDLHLPFNHWALRRRSIWTSGQHL